MSSNLDHTIIVKNITKSFKNLSVLKDINFSVERGTIFALLGPNGAGKTTMVKILSTLLRPDSGQANINGFDIVKHSQKVRSIIGLTGQYAAVDEFLSAQENLEMMGRLYHLSGSDTKRRTGELLKQFDLVDAAKRQVKTYSGGMRRRLDLALSLIASPPILFLDEPTTGLDPRSRLAVWEIVEQLSRTGTTIFLTTQYLDEADRLAKKIAVLDQGRIIVQGTAGELKQKVGNERIEFTVTQKSDFQTAVNAIKDPTLQKDTKQRQISIATSGSVKELKNVLTKLEKAKVEIDNFSVHTPTLDDVFMHFTGREIKDKIEKGTNE